MAGNQRWLVSFEKGLIRRVGDGQNIKIWNDNWLPRDNLLRALHPKSADPPEYVCELIDAATKSWDFYKVNDHF